MSDPLLEDVESVADRYEELLGQFAEFLEFLDEVIQQLIAKYPHSFSRIDAGEAATYLFRFITTVIRVTLDIVKEDAEVYGIILFNSIRAFQSPREEASFLEKIILDQAGNVLYPDSTCNINEPSAVRLIKGILNKHVATSFLKVGALKLDLR